MNTKKLIKLDDYIREKGMSLQEFHRITGLSYSHLARIKDIENPHVDLDTIIKIYNGTKDKFGTGLTPWEYLDIPKFEK